jgi:hypothetical protein
MKFRIFPSFFVLYSLFFILPKSSLAAVPAIQVSPLKYQDTMFGSTSKLGFVDVSNPSDSTIAIHSDVQAFRQINLSGDLQFYQNDAIKQGIAVSVADFELGPREASRIAFTIDPKKLPKGGIYASIFFSTTPKATSRSGTVILQSAKAGTLLILDNGGVGKKFGKINTSKLPFFQLGNGLTGEIDYSNTGKLPEAIAYNPNVGVRASWWGRLSHINGSLIFPGNTRSLKFEKKGNYLGFVPLVLKDKDTGRQSVEVVFAITGYWRQVTLILVLGVSLFIARKLMLARRSD